MEEKLKNKSIEKDTSFTDIVDIVYITPENSEFSMTKNGFLTLVSSQDVKPEKLFDDESGGGAPAEAGGPPPHGGPGGPPPGGFAGSHGGHHGRGPGRRKNSEIKYTDDGRRDYGRVILHRAFPFDRPDNIISVQQEDGFEIGIIKNLRDFDEDTVKILEESLGNKYYVPEITRIYSVKDRFGFVYFKCETNSGDCEFVVRNPFGSIIRAGENRIFIVDIDGNRYSVSNVLGLDKKSYRKIELYI